jgi:hypothetical protein
MAHLVPVLSLAADRTSGRSDDPDHCHLDGRPSPLALVAAKANLRPIRLFIAICCRTSARVRSPAHSLIAARANE